LRYLLYGLLKSIFKFFFTVYNRLEVVGIENIPKEGGVLVAANHLSYLDPPVLSVALKRRPNFIAKEGLFRIPLLGAFIRLYCFPVHRNRPQPSTIKEAFSRLKEGEVVVVFPEGGRSADGRLQDAKRGVGMIAAISRAPVIPTLIEGTDRALPMGAKFLRPTKIRVTFGNPIEIERDKADKHYQERVSREIMEAIKNLKVKVEDFS